MTKPVIAAAILILVDRNLISLDDSLYTYIPAFKHTRVYTGIINARIRLVCGACHVKYSFYKVPLMEKL